MADNLLKPLDLSTALKHAHAMGAAGVAWVDYNTEQSLAYKRVLKALSTPEHTELLIQLLREKLSKDVDFAAFVLHRGGTGDDGDITEYAKHRAKINAALGGSK